ncbi:cobaltochelatase CobN [Deinobacterium chartae]|uniref:Cobaltochelatase CobN n=1 Tax=Deinobacterium chartae TaxID=521158 RepID=A0A841I6I2_9DEIO|nr:hypothetical protein [Deinobacterium chartae]MBB6100020.1 cobaltochelatase CobN [Deinobacterium chartae]
MPHDPDSLPRRPWKHPALSQLIVCAGGTCGGPGGARVPRRDLLEAWKGAYLWRACHLSFSDCLGPCELAGNACLLSAAGSVWLGGLEERHYSLLAGWAAGCKQERRLLPLPDALRALELERFADPRELEFERKKS